MAKPGPKPGWRKRLEGEATPLSAMDAAPLREIEPLQLMSAADRENPSKLSGQALRDLAHRRGLSRSEMTRMDDEKIRVQLLYITNRQYHEAA